MSGFLSVTHVDIIVRHACAIGEKKRILARRDNTSSRSLTFCTLNYGKLDLFNSRTPVVTEVIAKNCNKSRGSLWFIGHTLFYLLFRGFYHIGIRKDRNNVAYK